MASKLESPYLDRKEIDLDVLQAACGSRVFVKQAKIAIMDESDEVKDTHEGAFVFRELVDVTGKKFGFERILDQKIQRYPDKKAGDKYLTAGSSTSGFTPIGFTPSELPHLTGDIIVCCGLADGYRIHEATGVPVACGVGEPSLPKLAKMIDTAGNCFGGRVKVIVAADNDKAGISSAMRSGYEWVVPEKHKDWSDVFQEEGSQAVQNNLLRVQQTVHPDELQHRLAELGFRHRSHGSGALEKANNWTTGEKTDRDAVSPVSVDLQAAHLIAGIDQYMELLAHTGVVDSPSARRFEAKSLEAHALLVSMLSDGLLASLSPEGQEAAEEHSRRILTMASQGKMDHIEVVVRSPVLVMPGMDDSDRPALRVRCDYDEDLKKVFKEAGGFWDKARKEWVIPTADESRLDSVLDRLIKIASGRVVAVRGAPGNGQGFLTGTPERLGAMKAVLCEGLEDIWEKQSVEPGRGIQEDTPTYSLAERDGWPMISIQIPYQARGLRDVLKEMGAKYNGESKEWDLVLREQVLEMLEWCHAKTEGPGINQIRSALDVCGFGQLEAINGDTYSVSAPYHAPLIERLKEGLPRLARRFDKESKVWHVDISSAVVARELKSIAGEFDLRLLDDDGLPLPRNTGWERVFKNGGPLNSPNSRVTNEASPHAISANHPKPSASRGASL